MKTGFRRVVVLGIALLVCLGGAISCSKQKSAEKAKPAAAGKALQILKMGNGDEVKDLDPQIVTGVPESHIVGALSECLVNPDPKTIEPTPGAAQSWSMSADQLVYTFKLQKNGKWSNGDPVTAQDFVYSYNRILMPKLASQYAYMLFPIKNAEKFNNGEITDFSKVGVKALDASTLEITLEYTVPYFLNLIMHHSFLPVHKATIEKFGTMDQPNTAWTREGNYVGNGSFVLKSWEPNKSIVVEKNPLYWDKDKVFLDQIHFLPINNDVTEERMFRSGEIDVTNVVPLDKIAVYKEKEPDLIRIDPYLGTYFYRMNVTKKPLTDKRVRQALAMTINRELLVEKVVKGGQLPAYFFVPPNTRGYVSKNKFEYNIEKAKKLLADAGYPNGKGFPKVEILFNTSEAHRVIAEAIQQMWKEALNIDVTLGNQEWKVYLNAQKNLQYQVCRAGWIGDYPDPNTFMDMFVTKGGNNQTGWSNKKYDELIRLAARTADQAKRYEIFQEAEGILLDEMPICPIYIYTRPVLVSKRVKNWDANILNWHQPYKNVTVEPAAAAGY
ncbi:MAG: peptide ABC transporter substrate-binding protein [Chitinivibrionales bacterium]|nr:peptide ABC transporter substrate-binding protein [Chitinivibrionales bacterium]